MEHYDGGAIDVGHGITLDPADTPELKACVGDTLITTDGRTLLGADDKARSSTSCSASPRSNAKEHSLAFVPRTLNM